MSDRKINSKVLTKCYSSLNNWKTFRKAATISISRQWSDLEFSRNENGKPSLIQNKSDYSRQNFEYNVSHHGDLVVLATGDTRIGLY